jgi:hypothetical protein
VFSRQDSNRTPQNTQVALPVWGIRYFSSVRLHSAPQLHGTTVLMTQVCARAGSYSSAANAAEFDSPDATISPSRMTDCLASR